LLPQRHRLLGAWLLGDLAAVREQLTRHRGSAAYLANVVAYGQAILAVEAPIEAVAAAAEQVRATAAAVRAESSALQKLLRDRTDLLARVVDGLVGGAPAPSSDQLHPMVSAAGREPLLSRILWFRLLAVGADRSGTPNPRLHALVAGMTRRFAA
nr:hypothetical protein [Kofleriaceae bacterium]